MKYTLLELVQNVMSSMDSDEVNSISDTVESQQVVAIIKTAYYDMIGRGGLTINKTMFNLDASGDINKPVLMYKPYLVTSIIWLKYNAVLYGDTDPQWRELRYLPLDEFMRMSHEMLPSASNINSMSILTAEGFTLVFNYRTDESPTYYTSFDDNTIIFDGHDNQVDTTLQNSKTLGYGTKNVSFLESDTFTPDLQPEQFALLLNEAKSLAWTELKQSAHPKAERTARRNWIHISKAQQAVPSNKVFNNGVHPFNSLPNFGRR